MILKAGFHFSVSFLSPFFCFSVSFLSPFLLFHEDDQSFSPAPDVFPMDLMHHWQPCFRTVSAILIVLSTVVAKDAISSFRVQSDPSTDSLSSISLLGWLKTCPEDLAKHAEAFLLMAAR